MNCRKLPVHVHLGSSSNQMACLLLIISISFLSSLQLSLNNKTMLLFLWCDTTALSFVYIVNVYKTSCSSQIGIFWRRSEYSKILNCGMVLRMLDYCKMVPRFPKNLKLFETFWFELTLIVFKVNNKEYILSSHF